MENEKRSSDSEKPAGIVRYAREVPFLLQAGEEMRVVVKIIAEEGEQHSTYPDMFFKVKEGDVYVEIQESDEYLEEYGEQNLTPLWERAREIRETSEYRECLDISKG